MKKPRLKLGLSLIFFVVAFYLFFYPDSTYASVDHNIKEDVTTILYKQKTQYESPTLDKIFTDQFYHNHHEFYDNNSSPKVEFIGVFFDDQDLSKIKYRVYHVINTDGDIIAFFYARILDQQITHVGTGVSTYQQLINETLYDISKSIFDIKLQLVGIDEIIFVKDSQDSTYQMASVLDTELKYTPYADETALENRNRSMNKTHEDYIATEKSIPEPQLDNDEYFLTDTKSINEDIKATYKFLSGVGNASATNYHLCIPTASGNTAYYWTNEKGYLFLIGSLDYTCTQIHNAMTSPGSNAYISEGLNRLTYTITSGTTSTRYRLRCNNDWTATYGEVKTEINLYQPALVGYKELIYGGGHMTVCVGYNTTGSNYIYINDGGHHPAGYKIAWNADDNDFIGHIYLSKSTIILQ